MQTYLIYGVLFASVVLLVEAIFFFLRSRLSGDEAANKRIRLIEKTGNDNIGLELIKARQSKSRSSLIAKLESDLWAADISVPPAFILLGAIFIGGLLAVILLGVGLPIPSALFLGFTFSAAGVFLLIKRRARSQRKKFEEQLIPAIDLIARGLQAGHPAAVALEIVSTEMPDPIGTNFGLAIDEISYGLDRDVALRNIAERYPSPDMSFFVSALEIQRETGGNLVEVLNNLTTMMRDRRAMAKKVKAISSEGRITAIVVGIVPFALIGFLSLMSPGYYTEAMPNPLFWPSMAGLFTLYLVGMYLIRRLVNIRI